MGTRWMRLGFVCAGVFSLAACADEQVWLGQAKLRSAECESTECADAGSAPVEPPSVEPPSVEPQSPAAPSEPPLVQVATLGRCDVPVSDELQIAQRITECGESPQGCHFASRQFVPSADGGAWVVGGPNVPTLSFSGDRLLRYEADGSLHCQITVDTPFLSLALDDSDHLWLARLWPAGASSRVERYDRDCQAIGGPLAGVNEVLAIANVPDAGVAIVYGRSRHVLTLRDQDGQALWSQPETAENDFALASAGTNVFVLGTATRRGAGAGVTVHALDALGATRWRATTQANTLWTAFSSYLASGSDTQGNLVLAFTPSDPLGQDGLWYYADVESISPSGQTRWVLRVPSSGNTAAAVAASGDVYIASPASRVSTAPSTIASIAQDGSSCQRLKFAGTGTIDYLTFSPSGQLWYATASEIGRLGPLP